MVWDISDAEERAVPIDLGIWWSVGDSGAHVLQSEFRCFLAFYLGATDQGYAADAERVGVIEWLGCRDTLFGGPNDEAASGHRLWSRGLSDAGYYGAAEVLNSGWIAARERANRVHPRHDPERFAKLHHFILLFHDTTFEFLAKDYAVERHDQPMGAVLGRLVAGLSARD